jgi:hypothetical protein
VKTGEEQVEPGGERTCRVTVNMNTSGAIDKNIKV